MFARMLSAAIGLVVLSNAVHAGTIYTDPAAFNTAASGLILKWSDNFEGYSTGVISGSLSIGNGSAEIHTPGTNAQQIFRQPATGNIAYWNVENGSAPQTTISGMSAAAFSFGYNMGGVGNGIYEIDFILSSGTQTTTLFETPVSYPNGENGEDIPLFMGWIGNPGEVLSQVVIKPGATGILADDTTAYSASSVTYEVVSADGGSFVFDSSEDALDAVVHATGGLGRSGPIPIGPGTYDLSFTVPDGFGVESVVCDDDDSMLDATSKSGSLMVGNREVVKCTITVRDVVNTTTGLIGAMMETRSKLILESGPALERRLNRLRGNYANNGGVSGFGLSYTNGNLPFAINLGKENASFLYSLGNSRTKGGEQRISGHLGSNLANILGIPVNSSNSYPTGDLLGAHAQSSTYSDSLSVPTRQSLGMEDYLSPVAAYAPHNQNQNASAAHGVTLLAMFDGGETEASGNVDPMDQRYDIWVEGQYSKFDATAGDGMFAVLHAGADYLATENLLIGLSGQFDWIDMDSATGTGTADGWGFMVGPYMTAKLAPGLFFDARGAWGHSYNNVSPFDTYEDTFDAERWLATAALVGEFKTGDLVVRPEARVSYFREQSNAYIDSLSIQIPSVAVETGAFEFGPTISQRITMEDGNIIMPYATLSGIWTFKQKNTATTFSSQSGLAEEGVRARVESGFYIHAENGLSLSVSGHYDGIGDDGFEAYGGKAKISREF